MGKKNKKKQTCSTVTEGTDLPNQENSSSHQANTKVNAKSNTSPECSNNNNESETTLTNAIHGNIFQLKLLMWFLFRAIDCKYKFKLSTENQNRFGNFDDVIFEYEQKTQKGILRLVQAKHILKNYEDTIKISDLLGNAKNKRDGFSLRKYFQSFCDKIIEGNVYENIHDCVILTNIPFNEDVFKDKGGSRGLKLKKLTTDDEFLQFGKPLESAPPRYKFIKTDEIRNHLIGDVASNGGKVYTERHVERFLDKLVFAVSSPNEQELGQIVKKLVGKHLLLSDSEFQNAFLSEKMLDWFKGSVIEARDQHYVETIITEIKLRMASIHLTGVSKEYQDKLKLHISFNQTAINEMAKTIAHFLILDAEKEMLKHIVSESPKYTAAKVSAAIKNDDSFLLMFRELLSEGDKANKIKDVLGLEVSAAIKELAQLKNDESFLLMSRKLLSEGDRANKIKDVLGLEVSAAIKELAQFKNDDSFLLMSRELLSEGDRANKIKGVLGLEGSPSLVVVVCENETSDDVNFCLSLIPEEKRNEKKIILIRIGKVNEDTNVYQDSKPSYEQLDDATKNNLLDKSISFQGVDTPVRDLISNKSGNSELNT